MNTSYDPQKLHDLCEAALEQRLTPEQAEELERLAFEFPDAHEYYIESVTQHLAMLKYSRTALAKKPIVSMATGPDDRPGFRRFVVAAVSTLVSVVILLLAVHLFSVPVKDAAEIVDATVFPDTPLVSEKTENTPVVSPGPFGRFYIRSECSWDDDSDALLPDGMVGAGRLHLMKGVAQIKFDRGVLLTIEAPARLTFYNRERCYLHSGRAFAKVDPEGIGFTIETTIAEIKDLGTEFGVNVEEGKDAEIQVFSGRVDIKQKDQSEIIPVTTGGWLRFDGSENDPVSPHRQVLEQSRDMTGRQTFVCTTAQGNGREACILKGDPIEHSIIHMKGTSRIFTLLKNANTDDDSWNRKGYFSIDLSEVPVLSYQDVRLELTFAPTGVGVWAHAPENAQFSVYGLLDETGDHWSEESITWKNAPGNRDGGAEVDPDKTVKLASFSIRRDEDICCRIVEGEELRRFLSRDTNQIVTFIVVRDTGESGPVSYAHGFANRHHPELPPPTLRFFIHHSNGVGPRPNSSFRSAN